jgi:hypothetical protein
MADELALTQLEREVLSLIVGSYPDYAPAHLV